MEKRVKKENNSDHLKQLPLIFFCISFWFFFLFNALVVFLWHCNVLEFSNLKKLQWTSHSTLHFSLQSFFAYLCSPLLASKSPHFPGYLLEFCWWLLIFYLLLSVLALPEDQSKVFFFFSHSRPFSQGSPSTFMDSIAPDLCLQRSYMSQFAMSIHRCGPSRGPEGHKTRTQSLVGRDWLL